MKLLAACLLLLSLLSCRAAEPSPRLHELQRWGTLREALHDGRTQARVDVAEVAREGVWGVGALAGLRGEITIADGEVWISAGAEAPRGTLRERGLSAPATVLFAMAVDAWTELAVEREVAPSELDRYVAEQARALGLDADAPFPFLVEGGLVELRLHVLAGECPLRARRLGRPMEQPAFELHERSIVGRLVGIHARDSAGVVCHGGSQSHVHALLEGAPTLTGHVESVGLAAGSLLKLPRP